MLHAAYAALFPVSLSLQFAYNSNLTKTPKHVPFFCAKPFATVLLSPLRFDNSQRDNKEQFACP